MHFIVELESQLEKIPITESCFVNLIPTNDYEHAILTAPCLVYIRPRNDKGYIVVVDHSEGFNLSFSLILEHLSKYSKIYCLDAKYHSYFIDLPLIDINYLLLEANEKPLDNKADTPLVNYFYQKHSSYYKQVNKLIPISKLYEYWEEVYEKVTAYFNAPLNGFYSEYTRVYKEVEVRGLKINTQCFGEYFTPHSIGDFFKNGKVYTKYNLYNMTGRPTNAFNGINFLALNKENHSRKCFIPENDYFVEFDFDGYHIRLIANLIGFELPEDIGIHTYFGKQYFQKDTLTEEEYAAAKQITFQNVYGGISDEYKEIPFYKALLAYLDDLYDTVQHGGNLLKLPTGRSLKIEEHKNPLTLFNYVIQNLETKTNVELISDILNMLRDKKSKVKLIVYDSFLIDFSMEDGKDLLINITTFLNSKRYPVKVKYGKDYDSLIKTSYL